MDKQKMENTCSRCDRCFRWKAIPDCVKRDLFNIWDFFPCPPPGYDKTRTLLELDWTRRMGRKDGCEALKRVALRCGVDLTNFNLVHLSVPECDGLFPTYFECGIYCMIAVALALVFCLVVILLIVVCCRYVRKNGKESSAYKETPNVTTSLTTQNNRYYAQYQYHCPGYYTPAPLPIPFEARLVGTSEVESRLLDYIKNAQKHDANLPTPDEPPIPISRQSTLSGRYRHPYEPIYWGSCSDRNHVPNINNIPQRTALERDRSFAESISDTSHVYDSISDNNHEMSYNSVRIKSRNSLRSNYSDFIPSSDTSNNSRDSDTIIRGYRYTQNPTFTEGDDLSPEYRQTRSCHQQPEQIEMENSHKSSTNHSLQRPKRKHRVKRRASSCSYNSNHSESTSLSDSSNRTNTPMANGTFMRCNHNYNNR
ncbi:hypothetical protein CHS0354_027551 [Potamilus streckersoni]|uniref:Uncharacterized protein n=1 Tax=Potamilus streckersoni TaxID=2493646 RepID=A0AAE0S0K8_9BIVA|nr:hypothetical protein CHS0354_027551 [Potamilus streckersoni]